MFVTFTVRVEVEVPDNIDINNVYLGDGGITINASKNGWEVLDWTTENVEKVEE